MSTRYNDGSHYENHQRAAELHDVAAHAHNVGEQHGMQEHLTGHERSRDILENSHDGHHEHTALRLLDTTRSLRWPISSGLAEAARKARANRIGSRPPSNYGRAVTLVDLTLFDLELERIGSHEPTDAGAVSVRPCAPHRLGCVDHHA